MAHARRQRFAKKATTLDGLFGWFSQPVSFSDGDSARWIIGEMVTGQYFQTLKCNPRLEDCLATMTFATQPAIRCVY